MIPSSPELMLPSEEWSMPSRRQDWHGVFLPRFFPKFQGSDVGDLLDLEIICGIEMATEIFEVMNIYI